MQNFVERIERIDHYISRKGTGSPGELARKIGVSERTIFEYIRLMKNNGAGIEYSRSLATYYYKNEGKFVFGFIQDFALKEQ